MRPSNGTNAASGVCSPLTPPTSPSIATPDLEGIMTSIARGEFGSRLIKPFLSETES
jgi:hypothetical protein